VSACKGCGKTIVWAEVKVEGKPVVRVPLDPRPPIYRVDRPGHATRAEDRWMVTHFATCPKANKFSGSKKNKEE